MLTFFRTFCSCNWCMFVSHIVPCCPCTLQHFHACVCTLFGREREMQIERERERKVYTQWLTHMYMYSYCMSTNLIRDLHKDIARSIYNARMSELVSGEHRESRFWLEQCVIGSWSLYSFSSLHRSWALLRLMQRLMQLQQQVGAYLGLLKLWRRWARCPHLSPWLRYIHINVACKYTVYRR